MDPQIAALDIEESRKEQYLEMMMTFLRVGKLLFLQEKLWMSKPFWTDVLLACNIPYVS